MSRSALAVGFAVSLGALTPASAAPADDLYNVLRFDELIDVMRAEGLSSADDLANSMGLGVDPSWTARVEAIYNVDAMSQVVRAGLENAISPEAVPDIIAFFETQPGENFLTYEIAAREALLDPDVEEAAQAAAAKALAEDTDRINQISSYIAANDIIESNVMGGMNGSFAFYRGMRAGGAIPAEVTDDILLQDVWQQEDTLRTSTTEWAYTYLYMAYAPASDADLDSYIAFSESDAGQEMTSALFAAFDVLFNTLSEAMGMAVAQRLATQEL